MFGYVQRYHPCFPRLSKLQLQLLIRFAILSGPINHLKHLVSPARLPFSIAYFGSLFMTLFFSIGSVSGVLCDHMTFTSWLMTLCYSMQHKSYFGALIGALIQIVALISYVVAYFPGGTQTLRFGSQIMLRGAGNILPI